MAINPVSRLKQFSSSPQSGPRSAPMLVPVRRGRMVPSTREEGSRMALQESALANGDLGAPPRLHGKQPLSLGFVSTFGPTKCGLATFTASLAQSLELESDDIGVVSCVEQANVTRHPDDVVAEWVRGSKESLAN